MTPECPTCFNKKLSYTPKTDTFFCASCNYIFTGEYMAKHMNDKKHSDHVHYPVPPTTEAVPLQSFFEKELFQQIVAQMNKKLFWEVVEKSPVPTPTGPKYLPSKQYICPKCKNTLHLSLSEPKYRCPECDVYYGMATVEIAKPGIFTKLPEPEPEPEPEEYWIRFCTHLQYIQICKEIDGKLEVVSAIPIQVADTYWDVWAAFLKNNGFDPGEVKVDEVPTYCDCSLRIEKDQENE